MADGILKSDPDGIWDYYVSLNKNRAYLLDTVKDIHQALDALSDRIYRKLSSIEEKRIEWEAEYKLLINKKSQIKDEEKIAAIQFQIDELCKKLKILEEQEDQLRKLRRPISTYLENLDKAYKAYSESTTAAKRILNAYLKMLEIQTVQMEMLDCGYSGSPNQYGKMNYRGTVFYCNGSAFPPTPENITLMERGNAPIGYDGKPVQLHHMIQSEKGGIVEISGSKHKASHKTLHINTSNIPSGIDRGSFDVLRSAYWKKRAVILKSMMRK